MREVDDQPANITVAMAIAAAFHWDMLSASEMNEAAKAAGVSSPSAYEKNYGGLSRGQKLKVHDWFGDDNILAMGSTTNDTITITHDGIDGTTPDGKAGEATIRVKVSDTTGRLIPPANGNRTVGQSFKVTAKLEPTDDITSFVDDAGAASTTSVVDEPRGVANSVEFVAAADDDPARYDIRIAPTTEKVAHVMVAAGALAANNQQLNFSLSDGNNLPFQILKLSNYDVDGTDGVAEAVYNRADIMVRPGAQLSADAPYDFTLRVNEFGNVAANSEEIDIRLMVVLDNVAPEFATGAPSEATITERASGATIATFVGTDANNQAVTFSIRHKTLTPERGASQDDIDNINDINANALAILGSIDTTGFRNSGVLKTLARDKKPDTTEPNFNETPLDDPDTEDVDESDVDPVPVNEYIYIITLNDGTLNSAGHEFTLKVVDADDPAAGSDQKIPIDEDDDGSETFGNALAAFDGPGDGDYKINQQIDNNGNIVADEEDLLFKVDETNGDLFLKTEGSINFENRSGIKTFTLSITRGTTSGIIVVTVTDVNERPKFSALDRRLLTTLPNDGSIGLYVLESDAIGTVASIGQDAGGNPTNIDAQFQASDQDTNPAWDDISYNLWYDADPSDDDDSHSDLYTGASALVTVDSSGAVKVNAELDTDADDSVNLVELTLRAYDPTEVVDTTLPEDEQGPHLIDDLRVDVNIIDTNVAPVFDDPSRAQTHASVSEGADVGTVVYTYRATDEDGDTVRYRLRDQDDAPFFTVEETLNSDNEEIGILRTAAGLDYETQTQHTVEIQAYDTDGDTDEIVITVDVSNVNDEAPGPLMLRLA